MTQSKCCWVKWICVRCAYKVGSWVGGSAKRGKFNALGCWLIKFVWPLIELWYFLSAALNYPLLVQATSAEPHFHCRALGFL